MVTVTVLYGHPQDPAAFEEHYANTHLRLVPNFQRYETARIVATLDGTELPYYRIFDIYFDDMERLQSSLSTPEGQARTQRPPELRNGWGDDLISEVDS
jgi:uncharacterized protein (TIGR02118 family)